MEVIMFGRLQISIYISIVIFGSLCTGYYIWRKNIEREALLVYNELQLEQSIKDKEIMQKQLEEINNKQKEIVAANELEKQAFKDKIDYINAGLNTKEVTTADKPASDILKKTINKLKDVVK